MTIDWFIPRRYKHFDVPVGLSFAERVTSPNFVSKHSFSPLISYAKVEKRYKKKERKTHRTIMYSSHRDAFILGYYAAKLGGILEVEYNKQGISDNVTAYRALKKANYHFSADALNFAEANMPCTVLAFDVSGFFDSLDHALLKLRLKNLLTVTELPDDWFKVFRYVTRYHYVRRDDIAAHSRLGPLMRNSRRRLITTVADLRSTSIPFYGNSLGRGIPQGTPISSTLANLYMLQFDKHVADECARLGAFFRRYSDDLILICREQQASDLEAFVVAAIRTEKLELNAAKTERTQFSTISTGAAQYLGFQLSNRGASIRPSSLGRQWRKVKQAVRRTKRVGLKAIAEGRASKIYTRKLRKRFAAMPLGVSNFSAYARRSAGVLASERILRQVRRLERKLEILLRT